MTIDKVSNLSIRMSAEHSAEQVSKELLAIRERLKGLRTDYDNAWQAVLQNMLEELGPENSTGASETPPELMGQTESGLLEYKAQCAQYNVVFELQKTAAKNFSAASGVDEQEKADLHTLMDELSVQVSQQQELAHGGLQKFFHSLFMLDKAMVAEIKMNEAHAIIDAAHAPTAEKGERGDVAGSSGSEELDGKGKRSVWDDLADFEDAVSHYLELSAAAKNALLNAFESLEMFGSKNFHGYKKVIFNDPGHFSAIHPSLEKIKNVRDVLIGFGYILLDLVNAREFAAGLDLFAFKQVEEKNSVDGFLEYLDENNQNVDVSSGFGSDYVDRLLYLNEKSFEKCLVQRDVAYDSLEVLDEIRIPLKKNNCPDLIVKIDECSNKIISYRLIIELMKQLNLGVQKIKMAMYVMVQEAEKNNGVFENFKNIHEFFINDLRRAQASFKDCLKKEIKVDLLGESGGSVEKSELALLIALQARFDDFNTQLGCLEIELGKIDLGADRKHAENYQRGLSLLKSAFETGMDGSNERISSLRHISASRVLIAQANNYIDRRYESPKEKMLRKEKEEIELLNYLDEEKEESQNIKQTDVAKKSARKSAKKTRKEVTSKESSVNTPPAGPAQSSEQSIQHIQREIDLVESKHNDYISHLLEKYQNVLSFVSSLENSGPLFIERQYEWAASYLNSAVMKAQHIVSLYKTLAEKQGASLSPSRAESLRNHERQILELKELQNQLLGPWQNRVARAREQFFSAPTYELFKYLHEQEQLAGKSTQRRGVRQAPVSYSGQQREYREHIEERSICFKAGNGETAAQAYPHFHYNQNGDLYSIFLKKTTNEQRFYAVYQGKKTYHGPVDKGVGKKLGKSGRDFVALINKYLAPENQVKLKLNVSGEAAQ